MYNYVSLANSIVVNNGIATSRNTVTLVSRRNTSRCSFPECRCKVKPVDGERITTPSHVRGITLCDTHMDMINGIDSFTYSHENTEHVGTRTKKGITTSFELESVRNTTTSLASLVIDLGFDATHDCTLYPHGIEHKSRIFDSLQSATKTLGTIEHLNNIGAFDTHDEKCGAHIHTGLYDNVIDFTTIYESIDEYMDVFGGLYAYLDAMPNAKMLQYFGRGFVNYARVIRKDGNGYYMPEHNGKGKNLHHDERIYTSDNISDYHKCVFNLQHTYSLEFRLPKFVNAEQYRKCIVAMQDVVACLYDNDFHNCSDKLVDIFKKYFPY